MTDRIITREILNDWICNDGLEHLFEEGYLTPGEVDPQDTELRAEVRVAYELYKAYEVVARRIQKLVDEAVS